MESARDYGTSKEAISAGMLLSLDALEKYLKGRMCHDDVKDTMQFLRDTADELLDEYLLYEDVPAKKTEQPMPVCSRNLAQAMMKLVTMDTLPSIIESDSTLFRVARNFVPIIKHFHDYVVIPSSTGFAETSVQLDHFRSVTFTIPDVTKVIESPALLDDCLKSAACRLRWVIEDDLEKTAGVFSAEFPDILLVVRRLLKETSENSLTEYGEMSNFGVRVSSVHNPRRLSQDYTISILYGIAKRKRVVYVPQFLNWQRRNQFNSPWTDGSTMNSMDWRK